MIDALTLTIALADDRAETHRALLESSALRTRLALVHPILEALGWDCADPARVRADAAVALPGDRSPLRWDLALLRPDSRPAALLDVYPLGGAVRLDKARLLQGGEGPAVLAGVTDGRRWRLLDLGEPPLADDDPQEAFGPDVEAWLACLPAHAMTRALLPLARAAFNTAAPADGPPQPRLLP